MKRYLLAAGLLLTLTPALYADKKGQARAQTQVQGAQATFGAIYTMADDFNLQLISAAYTLQPHHDYGGTFPTSGEKLLVLRYALKNARPQDNYTEGYHLTLVDEENNAYNNESGTTRYAPKGSDSFSANLKAGQGIGQDPAQPLTVAFRLPNKARIAKIVVNQGRKAVPGEKVLRYTMDAKNVLAPLLSSFADPSDKSGATALELGQARLGEFVPGGYFDLRCDGVAYDNAGRQPAEGKQFAVITMSARNSAKKGTSTYYIQDSQQELVEARDTNGQKVRLGEDGARKSSSDEPLGSSDCDLNEVVTYRYFLEVPSNTRLTSFQFGGGTYGHAYQVKL